LKIIYIFLPPLLPHIDNATDAISGLHIIESRVDMVEVLSMSDELVDLKLALHVVIDQVRKLAAALDTTERTSLPHTTSNELESYNHVSN
jgi:hypothetical protein